MRAYFSLPTRFLYVPHSTIEPKFRVFELCKERVLLDWLRQNDLACLSRKVGLHGVCAFQTSLFVLFWLEIHLIVRVVSLGVVFFDTGLGFQLLLGEDLVVLGALFCGSYGILGGLQPLLVHPGVHRVHALSSELLLSSQEVLGILDLPVTNLCLCPWEDDFLQEHVLLQFIRWPHFLSITKDVI